MTQTISKKPKLRFKTSNGTDYPDWETKKLGDIADIKTGDSNKQDSNTTGKYTFFDRSNDVLKSSRYLFDAEAIIVGGEGQEFIPKYFMGKFDLHQRAYTVLNFKNVSVKYAYYAIHVNRNYFLRMAVGSTVPSLRMNCFTTFEISIPCLDEQKQIADFLSAIDKRIELLQAKYDNLQKYKTGILQKIFTQQIRFKQPNGKNYPDWQTVRLGDIAKITTGKLNANAMIENGVYPFFTCAKESYKIDTYAFDTEALLISGNGANVGYIHYYNGKFNAYQRTYVLDNFKTNILYTYYLLENILHKRIASEVKDGNTPYIVKSTLSDLEITTPEPAEQQKIADFLSAIDEKITKTQTQITATKSFKQGLLQQMFI